MWGGRFNRADLVNQFGISVPQASADIADYKELAPTNLSYDKRLKIYTPSAWFKPVLVQGSAESYLAGLHGLATGGDDKKKPAGYRPPVDVIQLPTRVVNVSALRSLVDAIQSSSEIQIDYLSLRATGRNKRWITPHALAFDGLRWHARAWCSSEKRFRDFVLARIQGVLDSRVSTVDSAQDLLWHKYGTLILRPKHELSDVQRHGIETEFGMNNGELRVSVRRALIPYFQRRFNLDRSDLPAAMQPLEWLNRHEFETELHEADKQ